MFSKTQLAKKYIQYWLNGSNAKGHGVHSPFVYDLIKNVLNDKSQFSCYTSIENLRGELKKDDTVLRIQDFGAGSRVNSHYERSVSSIANAALKPKKFGQLLFRLAKHFNSKNILELGTSLGITSSYLASANTSSQVITMEGAPEVAATARKNFEKLQLENIKVVEGNFDETLPSLLKEIPSIDLAFIDGNHRHIPTVNYYHQLLPHVHEHSVLIFDDVHWSAEMEAAWNEIKEHEAVTLSIDLFFIGLVFFRKEQKEKQHFTIRF
jgi:predicted O-methyltransferase YrrM